MKITISVYQKTAILLHNGELVIKLNEGDLLRYGITTKPIKVKK